MVYLVYPISGITKNLGRFILPGVYRPGNHFELIPMVKMETRHHVEGSFGSKFPSIYNQYTLMDALSRKTLKILEKFLRFFGKKRPLTFFKFCSESFHCLTD